MSDRTLVAVDWGTTRFRATRLGLSGEVIDTIEDAEGGIRSMDGSPAAFDAYLATALAGWLAEAPAPILMAGMIGSAQGWREASYLPTPVSPASLAGGLVQVEWSGASPAFIMPGVSTLAPSGAADVMRGEETQILGACLLGGIQDGLVVLPGTHSKWARLEAGRITGFATTMTGELFSLMTSHSLLARTIEAGPLDIAAFEAGLDRARAPGGLQHLLFGVRTEGLLRGMAPQAQYHFLSGILVGDEIEGMRRLAPDTGSVHLVAGEPLARPYELALGRAGMAVSRLDGAACVHAGLLALARDAGLIPKDPRQ